MIGVVGDDTTGSLDIGVMFHRAGCGVQMFTTPPAGPWPPADVTILDTDSRLDDAAVAYAKVHAATNRLRAAGCDRFHKKTCSVFRGNVGAELDAMLDATGETTAIVAGAYPLLGRTTRGGRHFLNGQPLERTAFASDPIHPRTTSDLCAIIGAQSSRPAAVADLACVRAGPESLEARLTQLAGSHAYIVVDGETQEDLATLAAASTRFRVFGGSAGFAAEWPRHLQPPPRGHTDVEAPSNADSGVLFVSGSLTPQSKAQTARLRGTGIAAFELDPCAFALDVEAGREWAQRTGEAMAARIQGGESVLLAATQDPSRVEAGQKRAFAAGLDNAAYGRLVSGWLAEAAATALVRSQPTGLVVAGGDTSGSISRRLGITGCRIARELEPGVPLCHALGLPASLRVVFKSGSFGSEDFLLNAGHALTTQLRAIAL